MPGFCHSAISDALEFSPYAVSITTFTPPHLYKGPIQQFKSHYLFEEGAVWCYIKNFV